MKPNQTPKLKNSNKVAMFKVSFLDLTPRVELVRHTGNHRLVESITNERFVTTEVVKEDLDQYYVLEEQMAIMDLRIKYIGLE